MAKTYKTGQALELVAGEYAFLSPPVPKAAEFLNAHVAKRDDQFWWHPKTTAGDYRTCYDLLDLPSPQAF